MFLFVLFYQSSNDLQQVGKRMCLVAQNTLRQFIKDGDQPLEL